MLKAIGMVERLANNVPGVNVGRVRACLAAIMFCHF